MKPKIRLDSATALMHDPSMQHHFMQQSKKYPHVFFRNELARFWADNTRDAEGTSYTEYAASLLLKKDEERILIIHPEGDLEDIPFDYDGLVIQENGRADAKFGGPKAN